MFFIIFFELGDTCNANCFCKDSQNSFWLFFSLLLACLDFIQGRSRILWVMDFPAIAAL